MQNIQVRPGVAGDVYRVRLLVNGKSYSATRDTLAEAVAWRDQAKAALQAGGCLPGDVPAGDMTLGDASDKYLARVIGRTPATMAQYLVTQRHLVGFFGNERLLSSISEVDVYRYLDQRQLVDKVGTSAVINELSFLRQMYITARAFGVELVSPEANIPRPSRARKSREESLRRVITGDELSALMPVVLERNKVLYAFLRFLLYTGMRPSEAASLRWRPLSAADHKAATAKRLHVGFIDDLRGGFGAIGTKTGQRFVPGHCCAYESVDMATRWKTDKKSPYVFLPSNSGQKITPYKYFRSSFETARKNTVLASGEPLRQDIDFYSFRHTWRSRMAACGVQDSAAEVIFGHNDASMQAVYTHYSDAELVEWIDKLYY